MNKTPKLIAIFLASLLITLAAGLLLESHLHPSTATVKADVLAKWLDGTPFPNQTQIDWEIVEPGYTYSYNLTVLNNGTEVFTVFVYDVGLPSGWTTDWGSNGTLLNPSEWVWGFYNLTVPVDAVKGSVNTWDTYVNAET